MKWYFIVLIIESPIILYFLALIINYLITEHKEKHMKTFLIHCWDLYANGRQIKIKASNSKKAEKQFYKHYPRWFITKTEEISRN